MTTHRVSVASQTARRWEEGAFFCDICGKRRPLGDRRKQLSDGNPSGQALYVGALCCWEPEGGELDRTLLRSWATGEAARLSMKELSPPMGPDNVYYPGTVNYPPQSWIVSFSVKPLVLLRGGAAQSLVLTGEGFTAADTFAYGSTGITDAAPPALSGDSTTWTLDVQASNGMTPGKYRMVYNQDVFQGVFSVG